VGLFRQVCSISRVCVGLFHISCLCRSLLTSLFHISALRLRMPRMRSKFSNFLLLVSFDKFIGLLCRSHWTWLSHFSFLSRGAARAEDVSIGLFCATCVLWHIAQETYVQKHIAQKRMYKRDLCMYKRDLCTTSLARAALRLRNEK